MAIYQAAHREFIKEGYIAIGMDHFAKTNDSLVQAYRDKQLTRNFQGYARHMADDLIGLGVTAIGYVEGAFFQNCKTLEAYQTAIAAGRLPTYRGYVLQEEDLLRQWVIQSLMCHFSLDKRDFQRRFHTPFDVHFAKERAAIEQLKRDQLLEETEQHLIPTALGRLFIRIIASIFDAYLQPSGYSTAV